MTQRQSATRQTLADRLMGEPVADQVLTLGCLEDGEHRLMSTSESTDTLVFVRRAKSDSARGLTRTQEDAMNGARRVRQLESVQDKISQTVARVQREIAHDFDSIRTFLASTARSSGSAQPGADNYLQQEVSAVTSNSGSLGLVLEDARIAHVVPGGPAESAGLETDQYILAIDGRSMTALEIQRWALLHRGGAGMPFMHGSGDWTASSPVSLFGQDASTILVNSTPNLAAAVAASTDPLRKNDVNGLVGTSDEKGVTITVECADGSEQTMTCFPSQPDSVTDDVSELYRLLDLLLHHGQQQGDATLTATVKTAVGRLERLVQRHKESEAYRNTVMQKQHQLVIAAINKAEVSLSQLSLPQTGRSRNSPDYGHNPPDMMSLGAVEQREALDEIQYYGQLSGMPDQSPVLAGAHSDEDEDEDDDDDDEDFPSPPHSPTSAKEKEQDLEAALNDEAKMVDGLQQQLQKQLNQLNRHLDAASARPFRPSPPFSPRSAEDQEQDAVFEMVLNLDAEELQGREEEFKAGFLLDVNQSLALPPLRKAAENLTRSLLATPASTPLNTVSQPLRAEAANEGARAIAEVSAGDVRCPAGEDHQDSPLQVRALTLEPGSVIVEMSWSPAKALLAGRDARHEEVLEDLEAQIYAEDSKLKKGVFSRHIVGLSQSRLLSPKAQSLTTVSHPRTASDSLAQPLAPPSPFFRPSVQNPVQNKTLPAAADVDFEAPYLLQRLTVMRVMELEAKAAAIERVVNDSLDAQRALMAAKELDFETKAKQLSLCETAAAKAACEADTKLKQLEDIIDMQQNVLVRKREHDATLLMRLGKSSQVYEDLVQELSTLLCDDATLVYQDYMQLVDLKRQDDVRIADLESQLTAMAARFDSSKREQQHIRDICVTIANEMQAETAQIALDVEIQHQEITEMMTSALQSLQCEMEQKLRQAAGERERLQASLDLAIKQASGAKLEYEEKLVAERDKSQKLTENEARLESLTSDLGMQLESASLREKELKSDLQDVRAQMTVTESKSAAQQQQIEDLKGMLAAEKEKDHKIIATKQLELEGEHCINVALEQELLTARESIHWNSEQMLSNASHFEIGLTSMNALIGTLETIFESLTVHTTQLKNGLKFQSSARELLTGKLHENQKERHKAEDCMESGLFDMDSQIEALENSMQMLALEAISCSARHSRATLELELLNRSLNDDTHELDQTVESLISDIATLEARKMELEVTVDSLMVSMTELEMGIQSKKSECELLSDRLQEQARAALAEKDLIRAIWSQLQSLETVLLQTIILNREEREAWASATSELNALHQSLNEDAGELDHTVESLGQNIAILDNQKTQLEVAVESLSLGALAEKDMVCEMWEQMQGLETILLQVSACTKEQVEANARSHKMHERDAQTFQEQIAGMTVQRDDSQKALQHAKDALGDARERSSQLEQELESTRVRGDQTLSSFAELLGEAKEMIVSKDDEIQALNSRLVDLQSSLAQAHQCTATLQGHIKCLEDDMSAHEVELETSKDHVRDLKQQMHAAEKKRLEAEEQAKKEATRSKEELRRAHQQAERLQNDLNVICQEVQDSLEDQSVGSVASSPERQLGNITEMFCNDAFVHLELDFGVINIQVNGLEHSLQQLEEAVRARLESTQSMVSSVQASRQLTNRAVPSSAATYVSTEAHLDAIEEDYESTDSDSGNSPPTASSGASMSWRSTLASAGVHPFTPPAPAEGTPLRPNLGPHRRDALASAAGAAGVTQLELWGCEYDCGFEGSSFDEVVEHEKSCALRKDNSCIADPESEVRVATLDIRSIGEDEQKLRPRTPPPVIEQTRPVSKCVITRRLKREVATSNDGGMSVSEESGMAGEDQPLEPEDPRTPTELLNEHAWQFEMEYTQIPAESHFETSRDRVHRSLITAKLEKMRMWVRARSIELQRQVDLLDLQLADLRPCDRPPLLRDTDYSERCHADQIDGNLSQMDASVQILQTQMNLALQIECSNQQRNILASKSVTDLAAVVAALRQTQSESIREKQDLEAKISSLRVHEMEMCRKRQEEKEEWEATVSSLHAQATADQTRILFMETTLAAGGDEAKALTQEVKRLETQARSERESRDAYEKKCSETLRHMDALKEKMFDDLTDKDLQLSAMRLVATTQIQGMRQKLSQALSGFDFRLECIGESMHDVQHCLKIEAETEIAQAVEAKIETESLMLQLSAMVEELDRELQKACVKTIQHLEAARVETLVATKWQHEVDRCESQKAEERLLQLEYDKSILLEECNVLAAFSKKLQTQIEEQRTEGKILQEKEAEQNTERALLCNGLVRALNKLSHVFEVDTRSIQNDLEVQQQEMQELREHIKSLEERAKEDRALISAGNEIVESSLVAMIEDVQALENSLQHVKLGSSLQLLEEEAQLKQARAAREGDQSVHEAEVGELRSKLQALQVCADMLSLELQESKSEMSGLQQENVRLELAIKAAFEEQFVQSQHFSRQLESDIAYQEMQLAEREQEWQHQRRKDQSAHAEVEWQFQTKIEELKIQVEDLTSSLKRAEDSSEKANNMAADLANEMDKSKAIVAELKMELVSLQADAQEMSLQLVFDEDFSEVISREQEFKAQIVLQLEQLWQCNPGQIEVLSLHPVSAERRGKGSDAPVCEDQGKGCVQAMLILGSQMFAPGLTRVDAVANLRESSPLPCLSHTSINSPKRLVAEIEELRRQLAPAWEGVGAESMIDEDSQDDCAVAFRSSASSLADSIPSGGRSSVHATPLAESGPVHTNALMLSCNDPDVVAPVDTSASTPWIPALEVELARVQGERRSLEVEIQLADALASLEELRRERSEDEHIRVKIVELETQLAEARQVIHQLQQERSSTPSGSPQAGTPKELLEDHAWQLTADQSHSNATQIDSEMQRAEFGMAVDAHLAPRRSARTIEPKQHQNSKSPDSTRSASPFAKRSQDGLRGEEHEAANHALQDTKEELRVAHKRNEELAHLLQEKEESITLLKQRLQLQALSSLATPPKAGTGVEDVGLLGMESMHAHVDLMQDELASLQAEVDLCNAKSFQKVDNALQRLKDHQCGNSRENVRDIGRPVSANTDQAWHIECAPIDLPALVPRHPDAMVDLVLDLDFAQVAGDLASQRQVQSRVASQVSDALDADAGMIYVTGVRPGSLIVSIALSSPKDGRKALEVARELRRQALDPSSPLRQGSLTSHTRMVNIWRHDDGEQNQQAEQEQSRAAECKQLTILTAQLEAAESSRQELLSLQDDLRREMTDMQLKLQTVLEREAAINGAAEKEKVMMRAMLEQLRTAERVMLDALELQQAVSESQASRNACASSSVKGLECQLHAKTRQVLALQVDQTNQVEAAEMAENAMRGLWQQLKTLEAVLAQVYTETINVCLRSDAGATRLRMASVTVKRLKEASRDQAQAMQKQINCVDSQVGVISSEWRTRALQLEEMLQMQRRLIIQNRTQAMEACNAANCERDDALKDRNRLHVLLGQKDSEIQRLSELVKEFVAKFEQEQAKVSEVNVVAAKQVADMEKIVADRREKERILKQESNAAITKMQLELEHERTVYVQAFDVLKSEQHKEQEFVKQEIISRELEANVLLRKIEDLQADVTLLEDTMKQLACENDGMISQLHATNAVWKARAGDMELDRRVLMARIQTLEEDSQTEIRKLSALQDEDNQKKIAAAVQDAKAQRDAVEEEARGLRLVVEVLEEERKQALERDRRLDEQQAVMRMITGRDTSPARPQVGRTDYNLPTLVDGAHAADTFPYVKHAHAGIEVDTEQQPGVTVTAELCIPSPGLSSFTKLGREIGRVSPTLMPVSKQLSLLAEPTCTTGQENSEKRETWERRQRAMKRCEFETLKNQLGRVLARRLVVSSMRKSFAQWCRFFSVTTVSTFAVREAKAHMKTQVDRLKQELNASREELQHYVSRFNTPRDEYARRVEVTGNVEMLSLHDCLERSGILERTEAKQTESDVSKEHTPESAEVVSRSTPATLLELGSNEDDTTCRSLTDQDPFGRVAETILPPFLLPRLDSSTLGQHQAKPAERPVNDKEASRHSSNLLLDNSVRSGDVGDHVRVKIVELETQLAEARQVIHQLQQERSSTPSGSPQAGTPKELLEDHAWQQTADEVPVPEKMKPFLLSEPGALNAKDLGRLQSPQLTSELQYLHREELEKAESQFAELEAEVERQRTWMRDRETEMKKHLSEALDQQQLLRDMLASERARNESQSGTPCTVETQTQTEEDPSKQADNAEPEKEWGREHESAAELQAAMQRQSAWMRDRETEMKKHLSEALDQQQLLRDMLASERARNESQSGTPCTVETQTQTEEDPSKQADNAEPEKEWGREHESAAELQAAMQRQSAWMRDRETEMKKHLSEALDQQQLLRDMLASERARNESQSGTPCTVETQTQTEEDPSKQADNAEPEKEWGREHESAAELQAAMQRQSAWMRDRETEMKKHLSEALDQQQLLRDMLASERARNDTQSGTPCTVETQTQTEEDPSKQADNAEPGKEWGCENRCGFVGTFTEVEQHERTCAASNIKRFGIGNEQRRDQRIIAPKTAGPMPALLERTNSRESMRSHWSVLEECDSGDENKNRCGTLVDIIQPQRFHESTSGPKNDQPSAHAMTSQQRKWRCDWSCGFESTRFEDVAEHETVCPLAPEQVSALPTAQSYRQETASSQVSSTRLPPISQVALSGKQDFGDMQRQVSDDLSAANREDLCEIEQLRKHIHIIESELAQLKLSEQALEMEDSTCQQTMAEEPEIQTITGRELQREQASPSSAQLPPPTFTITSLLESPNALLESKIEDVQADVESLQRAVNASSRRRGSILDAIMQQLKRESMLARQSTAKLQGDKIAVVKDLGEIVRQLGAVSDECEAVAAAHEAELTLWNDRARQLQVEAAEKGVLQDAIKKEASPPDSPGSYLNDDPDHVVLFSIRKGSVEKITQTDDAFQDVAEMKAMLIAVQGKYDEASKAMDAKELLEAQVAGLRHDLEKVKDSLASQHAASKTVQAHAEKCEQEKNACAQSVLQELEQLVKEIRDEMQQRQERYLDEVAALHEANDACSEALASGTRELEARDSLLDAQRKQLKERRMAQEAQAAAAHEVRSLNDELRSELFRSQQRVQQVTEQLETLQSSWMQLQREHAATQEQLAEAQDVAEHRTSATTSAGLELEAQVAALTEALTAAKIDAEDAEQKHRSTISELVQVEEQLETYKLTLRDAEGALEECVKDREAEKERERALQEEAQEWKRKCMAAADEVESLQRSLGEMQAFQISENARFDSLLQHHRDELVHNRGTIEALREEKRCESERQSKEIQMLRERLDAETQRAATAVLSVESSLRSAMSGLTSDALGEQSVPAAPSITTVQEASASASHGKMSVQADVIAEARENHDGLDSGALLHAGSSASTTLNEFTEPSVSKDSSAARDSGGSTRQLKMGDQKESARDKARRFLKRYEASRSHRDPTAGGDSLE